MSRQTRSRETSNAGMHLTSADPHHAAEQVRLVREILGMMADMEATPIPCCWPPQEDLLAASLAFNGSWRGTMMLEATLPFSCAFAARFMSIPVPDSFDEDVRDALAELANMIAGNFKTLLPPICLLSVPEVALHAAPGALTERGMRGKEQWNALQFQTDFGSCCVLLQAHDGH